MTARRDARRRRQRRDDWVGYAWIVFVAWMTLRRRKASR